MIKTTMFSALAAISVMLTACGNASTKDQSVSFDIQNTENAKIGTLKLTNDAGKGTKIKVIVSGLTPGTHAMHFHEIGRCDAPDFKSSGGHFNPHGTAHGKVPGGSHAGDMMNIEIGADGSGEFIVTNDKVSINGDALPPLMDDNGSALVIHAKADDYTSQPSGAAGPREACAVVSAK